MIEDRWTCRAFIARNAPGIGDPFRVPIDELGYMVEDLGYMLRMERMGPGDHRAFVEMGGRERR